MYHSCAGYSVVKILCPSTYKELGEAFCSPVFQKLCDYAQADVYGGCLFCPLLIKNWDSRFAQLFFKSLDKRTKKAPAIVYVAGAVKVSFVNLD